MQAAPFNEGDRVQAYAGTHNAYFATVLRCQRDRAGWDVSVLPETIVSGTSDPRWVGSDLLTLVRRAGERS